MKNPRKEFPAVMDSFRDFFYLFGLEADRARRFATGCGRIPAAFPQLKNVKNECVNSKQKEHYNAAISSSLQPSFLALLVLLRRFLVLIIEVNHPNNSHYSNKNRYNNGTHIIPPFLLCTSTCKDNTSPLQFDSFQGKFTQFKVRKISTRWENNLQTIDQKFKPTKVFLAKKFSLFFTPAKRLFFVFRPLYLHRKPNGNSVKTKPNFRLI